MDAPDLALDSMEAEELELTRTPGSSPAWLTRTTSSSRFVAMETGGARVLVAADGVGPESEALAAEDIGPESEEVAAEDVVDLLVSVDNSDPMVLAADGMVLDSQEVAADGMVPDSQEVAANGVALDSQEPDEDITPELLELPPDSMEVVPDSLPPGAFVCGRSGLVHDDREAWNRAHSRFYPCPSCGLVHADYSIDAMLGCIKRANKKNIPVGACKRIKQRGREK